MVQLTENSDGGQIRLASGQIFEIALSENPTAGFRWKLIHSGEPVCILVGEKFSRGNRVGEPGLHYWQFNTQMAGSTRIELHYRRSWQEAKPPSKTFTLRIQISQPENADPAPA